MKRKVRSIVRWTFTVIVVLIFISSGIFKLSGSPATLEMAKGVGGVTNLTILAILELVFTILFLVPRTGILGSLLMIAYMGGAMAAHLVAGTSLLVPTIIQVLIWAASITRFPELEQRLFKKRKLTINHNESIQDK